MANEILSEQVSAEVSAPDGGNSALEGDLLEAFQRISNPNKAIAVDFVRTFAISISFQTPSAS